MVKLFEHLASNLLHFARRENALRDQSRQFYSRAARAESAYARYNSPAYLRRRQPAADALPALLR